MAQIIPLDPSPNQTFTAKVTIGGVIKELSFFVSYNDVAKYWTMDVNNAETGESILASIPLVPGETPALNILSQYAYLGVGSAYIIKVNETSLEWPDDSEKALGTDFVLVWSDTPKE